MANIDNTIVGEILKQMSGWESQENLAEAIGLKKEDAHRFFNGNSNSGPQHKVYWPWNRSTYVSASLVDALIDYSDNFDTFKMVVKKVFKDYNIPDEYLKEIEKMTANAELANYLVRCAKEEGNKKPRDLTQKQIRENNDMASQKPDCLTRSLPATLPETIDSAKALVEGCRVEGPHASFVPRKAPQESDLFFEKYGRIWLPEGKQIRVAYMELFGNGASGVKEYIEGKDLLFTHEDWSVDYRRYVTQLDFDLEVEKQRNLALPGHNEHPPKLSLMKYLEKREEDPNGSPMKFELHLTFGSSGYLENRAWREEMKKNKTEQNRFRAVIESGSGEHLEGFEKGPWSACGGGVWVVTKDNFLVMSFRKRVIEAPQVIGYSASGSYGRYITQGNKRVNNTPGLAIAREIEEELGIPAPNPEEFRLLSLGLDLDRQLVQFSHLWETQLTANEVLYHRENHVTTKDEQINFFVSLDTPDACYALLENCEMEPGAAFSLSRLLTKRFTSTK